MRRHCTHKARRVLIRSTRLALIMTKERCPITISRWQATTDLITRRHLNRHLQRIRQRRLHLAAHNVTINLMTRRMIITPTHPAINIIPFVSRLTRQLPPLTIWMNSITDSAPLSSIPRAYHTIIRRMIVSVRAILLTMIIRRDDRRPPLLDGNRERLLLVSTTTVMVVTNTRVIPTLSIRAMIHRPWHRIRNRRPLARVRSTPIHRRIGAVRKTQRA